MFKHYSIQCPGLLSFKVYGQGPCIVLLHPSPNNSTIMHTLAEKLAADFTVLCPDTPGYGASDKLDHNQPSMYDYALQFKTWLDHIGIRRCSVYGSATGAQIAIRLGIEYPTIVEHLYLDNCAHFYDDETEQILQHYFPDLTPQIDGSHLTIIWDIVSSLFQYFPWCFRQDRYKLNVPTPPADVLNAIAIDYLVAGKDYDLAYKAAFRHEKVQFIQQLTVATSVFRWQGSIVKQYTDRIFEHTLADNISGPFIPPSHNERYDHIVDHIINHSSKSRDSSLNLSSCTAHQHNIIPKLRSPPTPLMDGSHLRLAWDRLKGESTDHSANSLPQRSKQLQEQLIQWYL